MFWKGVAVAAFDALVLLLLYLVFQDLSWRASYVRREGLNLHTSFLPLIRLPTITGNVQTPLASPPVLDWAQVLILVLVVVNVLYLLSVVRKRSPGESKPANSG